jgi:general stress protein YciG
MPIIEQKKADTQQSELEADRPPTKPDPRAQPRRRRGFAAMDPALVREIARKGGKAAHAAGTAHEFASGEEARAAGRKGGLATHAKRRGEEQTPRPQK